MEQPVVPAGATADAPAPAPKKEPPALLTLLIDFGPAIVFFFTNKYYGIFTATYAVTAAAVVAAILSRLLTGRISIALIITTTIALVFGGLTLAFEDERFRKIQPTVVGLVLGAILLIGLPFKRPLLKPVLAPRFPPMADAGWFKLSRNFGLFFLFQAVLNEIVWRSFSTDTWVAYSSWGDILMTMAFGATQIPIISRFLEEAPTLATEAELLPPKS